MRLTWPLFPAFVLAALAAPALAQEPAEPAAEQPAAEQPAAEEPAVPAPVPGGDLEDDYGAGFAALTEARFSDAIVRLDEVAARSRDPERRAAARELARLARTLRDRRIAFTVARPPGPTAVAGAGRPASDDDVPGSGRTDVVATTTVAGFYAGFVVDAVFDVEDFRAATLVVTATTAGAFAGSLLLTRDTDLTDGMAASYGLGIGLGVANGLLLGPPLGVDDGDGILSLGLGGLALGATTGLVVGQHAEPTPAQVRVVGTLSVMGIATSGLGLVILEPRDLSDDGVLLTLAAGLDLGAAIGSGLAPRLDWSNARANLTSLSAFVGAVGGFGVAAIIGGEPDGGDEGRAFAAATLAGLWGGFTLGVITTSDMAPHPRFAAPAAARQIAVMPARIGRDGHGLSIAGAF